MNKKLLPLMFIFLITSVCVLASLISLDTWFVDSQGHPDGNVKSVEQGESVDYLIWATSNTGRIGYRVWMHDNGQDIDIIPHTVVYQNDIYNIETINTDSLDLGTNIVMVSVNNDGSDEYQITKNLFLTILPENGDNNPPYIPNNPNPANGATNVETDLTFSWDGGDADGDIVYYDFYLYDSNNDLVLYEEDFTSTYYPVSNLEEASTYHWKVVAEDSEYTIPGPIWSFTTGNEEVDENHAPEIPHNPNPANGAEDVGTNLVGFTWESEDQDGDTVYYDVYFGESEDSLERVYHDITENVVILSNFEEDKTYYWRVFADDSELGVFGPIWSFTTEAMDTTENHPPYAPQNLNPINGATNVGTDVELVWQGSDPDGDSLDYDVLFGTNPNSLDLVAENLEMESYLIENLEYETTYYWKIIAKDSEYETFGLMWSFTTGNEDVDENHNPVIESISDKKIECGKTFKLHVDASDVDGDVLHYYDNTNLFNIDENTGLISFKPSCSDRGTYSITITVTDDHGGKSGETFNLKIYKSNDGDGGVSADSVGFNNVIGYGQCIDDGDGDQFGFRQVTSKIVDRWNNVLSLETFEESCVLGSDDFNVYQFKGFQGNGLVTMILVILIFLIITVPMALYIFNKLS